MGGRKCVTVGLGRPEHCNNSPLKFLKAQNHYAFSKKRNAILIPRNLHSSTHLMTGAKKELGQNPLQDISSKRVQIRCVTHFRE